MTPSSKMAVCHNTTCPAEGGREHKSTCYSPALDAFFSLCSLMKTLSKDFIFLKVVSAVGLSPLRSVAVRVLSFQDHTWGLFPTCDNKYCYIF